MIKRVMILLLLYVCLVIMTACNKEKEVNYIDNISPTNINYEDTINNNSRNEAIVPSSEASAENNTNQNNNVQKEDVTVVNDLEEPSEKGNTYNRQEDSKVTEIPNETKEDKTAEVSGKSVSDNNQEENVIFMKISKDNVPLYDIKTDDIEPIEALDATIGSNQIPVSPDNPISIETTISESSQPANTSNIFNYEVEKYDVYHNTYDCVDGCWRFTESAHKGFYFYTMNDDYLFKNDITLPKMKRSFLTDGTFNMEYLDTEDFFYAPYEDEEGIIYAECGYYTPGGHSENPDLYICKMDHRGKTLSKIRISDLQEEGLIYEGFALIKKDMIALFFNQSGESSEQATQLQIIDLKNAKMVGIINMVDKVFTDIKSDGDYFILTSTSYQKVYVFDDNTYELVNTVNTTRCKELSMYEWKVNDWERGGYSNISFNVDIKDGQLYFLRHSGIYVTDCIETEFYKLLDGSLIADFKQSLYIYTSFYVGENNDFFILGVFVDEESATTMWHYIKTD